MRIGKREDIEERRRCGIRREDGVGIWGGDGFAGRVSESGLWGLVCGETSLGIFLNFCGFPRF